MENKVYYERLFDSVLDFSLRSKGAVIIEGPKWCGKSTTASRKCKTKIDLMPIETRESYIRMATVSPSKFLNIGEKPLLIDEWQHVSFLWDQMKFEVDKTGNFGQYILTGSVTNKKNNDPNNVGKHTGNGRIIRKTMRTMSLFESKESNGSVSISDLKNGKFNPSICDVTLDDYAYYLCRGGWPLAVLEKDKEIALQQAKDYYETIISDDIFSLENIQLRHDENKARKVLKSYARNVGTSADDELLRADCVGNSDVFDKDVFAKYLLALRELFVIEELSAWNPNLRSKAAIRTKETRFFLDPSIAAAALGATPDSLFFDIKTFGFLFESLAIRDLRIYADYLNANLYKYRDSNGKEADGVLQFNDGSFGLIEIKLGDEAEINKAIVNLKKIAQNIDTEKEGKLSFILIITKNNVAYSPEPGVYVVPLGCLKP